MAAMIEDLPALGKPTSPTSATVFSSRMRSRSCPGSPLSANPGALRAAEPRAPFPTPPRPPAAATNLVPTPSRSASTSPSAVLTSVPFGTAMIRSGPAAPVRFEPSPCRPLPARRTGRRWKSSSVAELASTSRTTSPPRPPLPPSGPPSGFDLSPGGGGAAAPAVARLHFQRDPVGELRHDVPLFDHMRKAGQVVRPAFWSSCHDILSRRPVTSSWRVVLAGRPGASPADLSRRRGGLGGLSRNDAHGPAATERTELHRPADQREQRVVAAPPHARAGVEMRAALADDDLARVHQLACVALHAQTLGLGVTAVAAG